MDAEAVAIVERVNEHVMAGVLELIREGYTLDQITIDREPLEWIPQGNGQTTLRITYTVTGRKPAGGAE